MRLVCGQSRRMGAAAVVALLLAGAACGGDDDDSSAAEETTTTTVEVTTTTTEPPPASTTSSTPATPLPTSTTSTTTPPVPDSARAEAGSLLIGPSGVALAKAPGGASAGRLRGDVVVAYDAVQNGWARILTPCENRMWARLDSGKASKTADVVLDAGHGGAEPGAVGPGGLQEKDLNLAVVLKAADALRAQGLTVVVNRPSDYRQTIASRVAVAAALKPKAFVSIHHNAEPDETRTTPGVETYYQVKSAESKRLAGLIYEEVYKALAPLGTVWAADRDAGTKYRTGDSGKDYYGILRRSAEAGVTATLAELGFVSNPAEEALYTRDDVRQIEADAVARGIVRFLRTDDPGTGFIEPYPRTAPAGPGGGSTGCVEPS